MQLTEWAKRSNLYYRLSFPVFADSFSSGIRLVYVVLYQIVLLHQPNDSRPVNYYLEEAPKKEELYRDINLEVTFAAQ